MVVSPWKPGDITFPSHWNVIQAGLNGGVAAKKGKIMTSNNEGMLVAPPTTSGVPDLRSGVFQVLATLPSQTADGQLVQVALRGSRIVMLLPASVQLGDRIGLSGSGTTPSDFTVVRQGDPEDNNYMGTVFRIYGAGSRTQKPLSAANDYGIIDLGMV